MTQPPAPKRSVTVAQIIGLLLAMGVPALIIWLRTVGLAPAALIEQRLVSTVAFWGVGVLLLFWVTMAEQRPLASIGLGRPTLNALGWGVAAGIAFTVALMGFDWATVALHLVPAPTPPAADADLTTLPLAMRAVLVVTSGFAEELLFIGYPIARLLEITRSRWISALITCLAFVALHIPGRTPADLVNVAFAAALFSVLFLWRKSLWTNIVAHTVVDLTPLIIAPFFGPSGG
ncbi:MAG: CPBP family intramembrane metalloprotease [Proteobacteria bacterium]|nr:CPBP family intramembrane metalloprotease [Pseudomonadota bacterium]